MIKYETDLEFHYEFIELLARRLQPKLYVELGIASGYCIQRVAPHCGRAIGVDIKPFKQPQGFEFFQGSSSAFATQVLPTLPPIEMAFIDADHHCEVSLADFENILPHVTVDGIILLHDTYPENEEWLTDDRCSNSYRSAEHIYRRAYEFGVEIVTLPMPPGLSIIRKRTDQLAWIRSDNVSMHDE